MSSRAIARGAVASLSLPSLGFLICYFLWIQQGCVKFFPFVSDFGIHQPTETLFMICLLSLSALLTAFASVIFPFRRSLLRSINAARCWHLANVACSTMFGVVIVSLAAIAFLPWDENLKVLNIHMLFSQFIFMGGIVAGLLGSVLMCYMRMQGGIANAHSVWQRVTFAIAVLLPLTAALLNYLIAMSFVNLTGYIWDNLGPMVAYMHNDFDAYCRGEGKLSLHHYQGMNHSAFYEICLVVVLLMNTVLAYMDMELVVSPLQHLDSKLIDEKRDEPAEPSLLATLITIVGSLALLIQFMLVTGLA